MIDRLTGILVAADRTEVVVDCNGVGYAVSIPLSTADSLPDIGQTVTLLTIYSVREDSVLLYGFISGSERDMFRLLISVSGIGGRTALGILSSVTVGDLCSHIVLNNAIALQKLPGVGRKTAERLALELREKVAGVSVQASDGIIRGPKDQVAAEAVKALMALGFTSVIADKTVRQVLDTHPDSGRDVETLLRKVLKAGS